jgi:cytochrome c5
VEQSNKTFFTRFGVVIAALLAATGGFALIAHTIDRRHQDRGRAYEAIEMRIAPVAQVITSDSELAQLAALPPAAPAPSSGGAVLQGAAQSGEQLAQQVCSACHGPGLLGAPKMHDAKAWQTRLSQAGGIDGLVASAARGKNQMPPRGGNPQLSDGQLREAIEAMSH